MSDRSRIWPVIVLGSAAAAALAAGGQLGQPITVLASLWFLLVIPGMAVVHPLRLGDPVAELSLAVALSLALDTLVASAFLYAGGWWPAGTLAVLIGIAAAGAAADLLGVGRRRAHAQEAA